LSPLVNEREEAFVLGALFHPVEGSANLPLVLDRARPEDFTSETCRSIFEAAHSLFGKGHPVDPISVVAELKRRGKKIPHSRILEILDSSEYLAGMSLDYHLGELRQASNRRKLKQALQLGLQEVEDPSLEYCEVEEKLSAKVMAILDDTGDRELRTAENLSKSILDHYYSRKGERQDGQTVFGIPTPFPSLDAVTGGLQEGTLTVLAGRQAHGKSTVEMDMLFRAAKQGVRSFCISLEQPCDEVMLHLVQKQTGLSPLDVKKGNLTQREERILLEAHDKFKALPLFFEDRTRTLAEVSMKIRRMVLCHGVRFVGLDYLQLIENHIKGEPRHIQVAGISRTLKRLAIELKISILGLSQLNQNPEERLTGKICLRDTRESEAISQDADLVLFLHRPRLLDNAKEDEDFLELAKNRYGPTIPRISLEWDGRFNTYREARK